MIFCLTVVLWVLVGVVVYIDILEINTKVSLTDALITGFLSVGIILLILNVFTCLIIGLFKKYKK